MMDVNTRIIDLTVGDLMKLLHREAKPQRFVYGIAGIASIFNCSMATAQRIKSSGRIDDAITQSGKCIVTDVDKALQQFNHKKQ